MRKKDSSSRRTQQREGNTSFKGSKSGPVSKEKAYLELTATAAAAAASWTSKQKQSQFQNRAPGGEHPSEKTVAGASTAGKLPPATGMNANSHHPEKAQWITFEFGGLL